MNNGRGHSGRFAKGNQFSKGFGRPPNSYTAKIKAVIEGAANQTTMRKVVKALLAKAEAGDVQAAKLVLEYTAGKPAQRVEISDERPIFDIDDVRAQLAAAAALDGGAADAAAVDVPPAPAAAGEGGVAADDVPQLQPADR